MEVRLTCEDAKCPLHHLGTRTLPATRFFILTPEMIATLQQSVREQVVQAGEQTRKAEEKAYQDAEKRCPPAPGEPRLEVVCGRNVGFSLRVRRILGRQTSHSAGPHGGMLL